MSLTGGDQILLSEDEAQGYWGPAVFLTTDDPMKPWSLMQQAAYWSGGTDPVPLEWGAPTQTDTPSINQLTESLQKSACLQLMLDRCATTTLPDVVKCQSQQNDPSNPGFASL